MGNSLAKIFEIQKLTIKQASFSYDAWKKILKEFLDRNLGLFFSNKKRSS